MLDPREPSRLRTLECMGIRGARSGIAEPSRRVALALTAARAVSKGADACAATIVRSARVSLCAECIASDSGAEVIVLPATAGISSHDGEIGATGSRELQSGGRNGKPASGACLDGRWRARRADAVLQVQTRGSLRRNPRWKVVKHDGAG
jgi:hypothetical protein